MNLTPRERRRLRYCADCGTVGYPYTKTKGSFFVELGIWLSGLLLLAVFAPLGLLLLVCGLVFTLWRVTSSYKACPECDSPHIMPVTSPVAQRAFQANPEAYPFAQEASDE